MLQMVLKNIYSGPVEDRQFQCWGNRKHLEKDVSERDEGYGYRDIVMIMLILMSAAMMMLTMTMMMMTMIIYI